MWRFQWASFPGGCGPLQSLSAEAWDPSGPPLSWESLWEDGLREKASMAARRLQCAVHVWILERPSFEPRLPDFLSAEERQKWQDLPEGRRKNEYRLGRSWLRIMLGAYLGSPPKTLAIGKETGGKPVLLKPGTSLAFNLAHCDTYLALALGDVGDVGIDVESSQIEPEECLSLSRRFFSPEEQAWVAEAPQTEKAGRFLTIFTQKEARLKCSGAGFREPLETVKVALSKPPFGGAQSLDLPLPPNDQARLSVYTNTPVQKWEAFTIYHIEGERA